MRRLAVSLLTVLLLILCLGVPPSQVQAQEETATPTATATLTPTLTPTPDTRIFIPLSSDNSMVINRYITYGDIAVSIFLLVLTMVGFVFGLIRLLKK